MRKSYYTGEGLVRGEIVMLKCLITLWVVVGKDISQCQLHLCGPGVGANAVTTSRSVILYKVIKIHENTQHLFIKAFIFHLYESQFSLHVYGSFIFLLLL